MVVYEWKWIANKWINNSSFKARRLETTRRTDPSTTTLDSTRKTQTHPCKKMKAFKNVRVQTGRKRGYKFDLDLHRCSKLVKQGVAS